MITVTNKEVDQFIFVFLDLNENKIDSKLALTKIHHLLEEMIKKNKLSILELDLQQCLNAVFLNIIELEEDELAYRWELLKNDRCKINKRYLEKKYVHFSRAIGICLLREILDLKMESMSSQIRFKNVDLSRSRYFQKFESLINASIKLDEHIEKIGHYDKGFPFE